MLSSVTAGLAICCGENQRCTPALLIGGTLIWPAVAADCYAEEVWTWMEAVLKLLNRQAEADSPTSARMLSVTEKQLF